MTQTQSDAPVLVVDDNARNRMVIEGHLEAAGHRVVSAASGERAVELFEEIQPALVLLDILMPGMDGFELLERLETESPVIFITARPDERSRARARQAGAIAYLTKPFQMSALREALRSVLS